MLISQLSFTGPLDRVKQTLLNIILGFIKPKNGKILIDDIISVKILLMEFFYQWF